MSMDVVLKMSKSKVFTTKRETVINRKTTTRVGTPELIITVIKQRIRWKQYDLGLFHLRRLICPISQRTFAVLLCKE